MIRWYGVMYMVAFWLAWAIVPSLGKIRRVTLSRDDWTRIIAWGALGVLVGGRLGYVFLYDFQYFLAYPIEILKIWHGGMSSHGGFIGAALGVWFATRLTPSSSPFVRGRVRRRIPLLTKEGVGEVSLLTIADILTVPAAIGLTLGRIGNITNGEFGMYPYYEAVADVVIAAVCFLLLYVPNPLQPACRTGRLPLRKGERTAQYSPPYEGGGRGGSRGSVFALFLILYSIVRFILEYVRPQEWSYILGLTRGQAYTIPILIIGVILWRYADK